MNRADREAEAKRLKDISAKETEKRLNDLRKVLSIPEGRRLFWWLMSETGLFKNDFIGEVSLLQFQSGQKNIGSMILGYIEMAGPGIYPRMRREAISNQKQLEQKMQPKGTDGE